MIIVYIYNNDLSLSLLVLFTQKLSTRRGKDIYSSGLFSRLVVLFLEVAKSGPTFHGGCHGHGKNALIFRDFHMNV